jgi:CO/xanthine dehydrogenase Mo-binding subunit
MTPNRAYWAAHCAAFSDGHLLRFLTATERLQDRYAAAQQVAEAEARRRNLIKEKAPVTGGQSTIGRKQP